MADNGTAPTEFGSKLVRRDFSTQVASLGNDRVMQREVFVQYYGQFNPELITLDRLHAMRRDPMLKMGSYYTKGPLLRLNWHAECADPQIAQGVDEIVRAQWSNYTKIGLTSLDYGYQGGIKQFELGQIDGEYEDENGSPKPIWTQKDIKPVVLDDCIPLPPDYTRVRLRENDGGFNGLTTALWAPVSDPEKNKTVEAEYALWWANEFEETWNNYYGYPLLGYAYRYWWSSWFRHHMEDRHFEQDADPPLQVWYPPGSIKRGDETVSHKTIALELADDLRGGAAVAIPSDVYIDEQGKAQPIPLWRAEFLKGGENLAAFKDSAERLDVMKLRSLLVPEQALIEGVQGTGSRATSSIHTTVFLQNLEQRADDLLAVWNKYIIPQIVEANWGSDAPKCTLVSTGFQDEDTALMDELIKAAFNLDPNALPIKFEEILKKRELPMYTPKEQQQREDDATAAQDEQQRQQEAAAQLQAQIPTGPQPNQAAGISAAGRYFKPRETIYLHQGTKTVDAKQPAWAHDEFQRRASNVSSLSERLEEIARERYDVAFEAAADFLASESLELASVKQTVGKLMDRMVRYIKDRVGRYRQPVQGELAGLYHAAGAAELERLDMAGIESWDIGRDEVQVWAAQNAGRLITTMDQTLVDEHLRPFLEAELQSYDEQGVSGEPIELAQRLSDKFAGYPEWMARRVARTEARMGYNNSALDMWDRVGISFAQAYDGQGGETGQTDAECLRRNGEVYSLEEARAEDAKEHPNGTLGFLPVVDETTDLVPLEDYGVFASQPVYSSSPYAITEDGWILSRQETGAVFADLG